MKNLVKSAAVMTALSLAGGAQASSVTNVYIGLTALVSPTCSTAGVFVSNLDLSGQIASDNTIADRTSYDPAATTPTTAASVGRLDLTTGLAIACSTSPTSTTLTMVSANTGVKSGSVVLPYNVMGQFGAASTSTALSTLDITRFDSAVGPSGNLLKAAAITPEAIPALTIALNAQATAVPAGNYADTLTITVTTNP